MQERGIQPDDPEYIKAHNLLSAVQRQQTFQRQRHIAQQQQLHVQRQRQAQQAQQNQPPQQMNGVDANGASNGITSQEAYFFSSNLISR